MKNLETFPPSYNPKTKRFRKECMLNSNGKPIPLQQFLILNGERTLITERPDFSKTEEERAELKTRKKLYKQSLKTKQNV
jgi:hypothetical protein